MRELIKWSIFIFMIFSSLLGAKELESVAKSMKKSQKEIVESALDFYFDYTDSVVADSITREIKDGKMRVYKSEDVYKELGIEI